MEKVFYVQKGNLEEVNKVLAEGGKVKMIEAIAEALGGETFGCGDTYAYVVIEMPKH